MNTGSAGRVARWVGVLALTFLFMGLFSGLAALAFWLSGGVPDVPGANRMMLIGVALGIPMVHWASRRVHPVRRSAELAAAALVPFFVAATLVWSGALAVIPGSVLQAALMVPAILVVMRRRYDDRGRYAGSGSARWRGINVVRRARGVVLIVVVFFTGTLVAPVPVAADDLPPLPLPGNDCYPVTDWYLVAASEPYHSPRGDRYIVQAPAGGIPHSERITISWTHQESTQTSWELGGEMDLVILTAKGHYGETATKTDTITKGHHIDVTVQPGMAKVVEYGYMMGKMTFKRKWSRPGCNREHGLHVLPWLGLADTGYATVILGQGWNMYNWDLAAHSTPLDPGPINPPSPEPKPVTSVYGLADGTVLHTTDTQRIYKMVGGAPVWQATCDDGICLPESRPTTQAVIDDGPDVPRNGSSAIDQRGRVYIFVGGAPLWQSHCSAPVNCGTPVKISNWSIDARDHMNDGPADRQLIQGWSNGRATPVAQTVGGARVNFANEQEVRDTGFGADWRSKVVTVSTESFNALGEVPRDGTLLQGTGGGASTPVAMFVGGARINFANEQEVVETGYGGDWRSKVRAIPKRAFDAFEVELPPDATLVQGISNGVATPVAQMVGGTRINFASPQEIIAAGFGENWRSKVRTIPTRVFNLISDGPPPDGTLIQGTGDTPTPVAQMLGGGRINFASPEEVIAAGHGSGWRDRVHAIPNRVYNAIYEGIAHGTRVQKAGAPDQAAIVGGAKLPFANMAELEASSFDEVPVWPLPGRIWDALPTRVADDTPVRAAQTGSLFRFNGGEADLAGQCPDARGCESAVTLSQSMIDPIAHGVANRGPAYGVLGRYNNGSDHFTTTGSVPAGYRLEGTFGLLSRTPAEGTRPLFACLSGTSDAYTSTSTDCGGRTKIARLGWIWEAPPEGRPSTALYRCKTESGEHFDSVDQNCGGLTYEGRLGYVLAYAQLTRYNNGSGDHGTAVAKVPAGYQPEGTLGLLPSKPQPGTTPLYSCRAGGSQMFTSLSSDCGGHTKIGVLGHIFKSPPQDEPSLPLYRCKTSGGDHFDSVVEGCGGHTVEGRLGYTIGTRMLSRGVRGTDHRSAIGVFPPGYRYEGMLGYLAATNEPGTRALYACRSGGNSFTSLAADCGGYTRIGHLGWIWSQKPDGPYSTLYRCKVTETGEHFDATSEECEGQAVEGFLGYLRLSL